MVKVEYRKIGGETGLSHHFSRFHFFFFFFFLFPLKSVRIYAVRLVGGEGEYISGLLGKMEHRKWSVRWFVEIQGEFKSSLRFEFFFSFFPNLCTHLYTLFFVHFIGENESNDDEIVIIKC